MSIQSALLNASQSLRAFSRVLDAAQNNVANATTPGYARQTQLLVAAGFDAKGQSGGVRAGEIRSARDEYSEQAVRRETTGLGTAQQQVETLGNVQTVFDITGKAGIAGALSDLYTCFSSWGQSPANPAARQTVVDNAGKAAQAFQQTANALMGIRTDIETQLKSKIDAVNRLTAQLADANREAMQSPGENAGIDARIHATLEELAEYVPITSMPQANGSVNVLLDGQIPLVLGSRDYELGYQLQVGAYPSARITADGADVTDKVGAGRLGALLDVHNRVLPSYLGTEDSPGELNLLAIRFADRVNGILGQGYELFSYDPAAPSTAAQVLSVPAAATAATLAAAPAAAPLSLAGLTDEIQDSLGGFTFTEFYGQMAAHAGALLNSAGNEQEAREAGLAQAKDLREQMSGVSLDEEAMVVVEFQRAYEAVSKLVTILDQLTEQAIGMLQT